MSEYESYQMASINKDKDRGLYSGAILDLEKNLPCASIENKAYGQRSVQNKVKTSMFGEIDLGGVAVQKKEEYKATQQQQEIELRKIIEKLES